MPLHCSSSLVSNTHTFLEAVRLSQWTGYCAAVGITASQASGVISVTTGLQIIGRVLSGTMADLIGPINVLMLFTFMMGLMCIVIWYFATNLGVMMVFAIFYGLFAGGEAIICLAIIDYG